MPQEPFLFWFLSAVSLWQNLAEKLTETPRGPWFPAGPNRPGAPWEETTSEIYDIMSEHTLTHNKKYKNKRKNI